MGDEKNKSNENQPEKSNSKSQKEQERMEFLEYLQKTAKEREKRKKDGKDKRTGLEGTHITTWKRNVVHDEPITSVMAKHYRDVFRDANEEEEKEER